jgi:YbgC/YbaW family acyl-CoA thioester hydrolase
MTKSNKLRFTVAFDEADGEGIVFFGNYFRLIHRAFEHWLPSKNITWEEWFKNPAFGVPLRHVESDYRRPLRPGDAYDVEIRVKEIGESSVHFEYHMTLPDGSLVAQLKTSHVFVSRPDMKKLPVPETLRTRLS